MRHGVILYYLKYFKCVPTPWYEDGVESIPKSYKPLDTYLCDSPSIEVRERVIKLMATCLAGIHACKCVHRAIALDLFMYDGERMILTGFEEAILRDDYSDVEFANDIRDFGRCAWKVLTGRVPVDAKDAAELIRPYHGVYQVLLPALLFPSTDDRVNAYSIGSVLDVKRSDACRSLYRFLHIPRRDRTRAMYEMVTATDGGVFEYVYRYQLSEKKEKPPKLTRVQLLMMYILHKTSCVNNAVYFTYCLARYCYGIDTEVDIRRYVGDFKSGMTEFIRRFAPPRPRPKKKPDLPTVEQAL